VGSIAPTVHKKAAAVAVAVVVLLRTPAVVQVPPVAERRSLARIRHRIRPAARRYFAKTAI